MQNVGRGPIHHVHQPEDPGCVYVTESISAKEV